MYNYLDYPLKHCPFCGSKAKRTGGSFGGVVVKICRCSNNECIASFKSVDYDVWNTRPSFVDSELTTTASVVWLRYEGNYIKED
jgi:hypothetical protein